MSRAASVHPLLSGYRTAKARLALAEQRLKRLEKDKTDLILEAEQSRRAAVAAIDDTDTALARLPVRERRTLEVLFCEANDFPFDLLCDEFFCDERTVYRVRRTALKHFSEIVAPPRT